MAELNRVSASIPAADIAAITGAIATIQSKLPFLVGLIWPLAGSNQGLLLVSSAGLLIVVGVVRDIYRSIEAELKLRGYDSAVLVH